MKRSTGILVILVVCMMTIQTGCSRRQDATSNDKMVESSSEQSKEQVTEELNTQKETKVNPNAVIKDSSTYDCDIKADKEKYDGSVDIVVGDNYYATQINDWYMYFDQYDGKTVEIEGYYINDFAPYEFIGRYGPSCPYCQGGYVCFELLTDEDLSSLPNASQWIKVRGILRQGGDSIKGPFYYIEVMDLKLMDEVGMDTVTN